MTLPDAIMSTVHYLAAEGFNSVRCNWFSLHAYNATKKAMHIILNCNQVVCMCLQRHNVIHSYYQLATYIVYSL